MGIPRLYAIADSGALERFGVGLWKYAEGLAAAGATLIQYRDKDAGPRTILREAAALKEAFSGSGAILILNDRPDLALLAGWAGVHVGQRDLSPEDAKTVLAGARTPTHREEQRRDPWGTGGIAIVGVSTHTDTQVVAAEAGVADYVAIGPVFATGTKLDASPVVGLDGVRRARALTTKPLVAIGGITRTNARSVIEAGADSVAVISGLFVPGETVEKVTRDFLGLLR